MFMRSMRGLSFVSLVVALHAQYQVDVRTIQGPGDRWEPAFAVDPSTALPTLHGGHEYAGGTSVFRRGEWTSNLHYCVASGTPPIHFSQWFLVDPVRQRLLLVGGDVGAGSEPSIWQLRSDCWTCIAPPSTPALPTYHLSFAYDDARDRIVAYSGTGTPQLSRVWEWDGAAWTLCSAGPIPPPRGGAALVYDRARQRTMLVGGANVTVPFGDTWSWDGASWTQHATASGPGPAAWPALVYDDRNARCILHDRATESLWAFDGMNWSQLASPGNCPIAFSIAYDPFHQRLLGLGGFLNGYLLPSLLQQWSGTAWIPVGLPVSASGEFGFTDPQKSTAMVLSGPAVSERTPVGWMPLPVGTTFPSASNQGAAYDVARQRLVVFGGSIWPGTLLDETWEWTRAGWTQAMPALRPSPREGPGLAHDPAGGGVLLFGGSAGTTFLNDSWSWNGTAWTQHLVATAPSPRTKPAMATDPRRSVVVLHGGMAPQQPGLWDTWEWNGAGWVRRAMIPELATVADYAMTFDQHRNVVCLAGGWDAAVPGFGGYYERSYGFADWDGNAWTGGASTPPLGRWRQRQPSDPPPNKMLAFGFDPQSRRCVLCIGYPDTCCEYGAVQQRAKVTPIGWSNCSYQSIRILDPTYVGKNVGISVSSGLSSQAGATILLAGLSSSQWNGVSLPLDLSAFGSPGCTLRVAPDTTVLLGTSPYPPPCSWAIPNNPQLAGMHVALQAAQLAPAANPLGLLLGYAVEIRIGLY